jgi:hypothetical protein
MERRGDTRLAAGNVIPVQITGLGDLQLQAAGCILDVSPNGLRIGTPKSIPVGSFLRILFDDAAILSEVRYCQKQKDGYAIGVYVEEILIGTSELARLVSSLLSDESGQRERESSRSR